jgi:hypothetical protein
MTSTPQSRQGQALNAFKSGLKSTNSQGQYPQQIKPFFNFIFSLPNDFTSSLEEKADAFVNKAKNNPQWAQETILNFIDHCKRRVNIDKTLTVGTLQHTIILSKHSVR